MMPKTKDELAKEAEASFTHLFQLVTGYDSGPAGRVKFDTFLKMAFVQFTLIKSLELLAFESIIKGKNTVCDR